MNMTYKRFFMEHASALPILFPRGDKRGEFIFMPEYNRYPNNFVLKTDYTSYALTYDCQYIWPFGVVEWAWIYCKHSYQQA